MRDATIVERGIVARDGHMYSSHPHAALAADGDVVVVFNRTFRRNVILHPPHDPEYRNLITRSSDLGRTWSPAQVVPGYDCSGTECAGITTLRSGRMLLNQWRNHWYPLGAATRAIDEPIHHPDEFVRELVLSAELDSGEQMSSEPAIHMPWIRGHGTSFMHISEDGGRSFPVTATIDAGPFHGGYGLRGCVELPYGELLLPLNDIPEFRTIFVVRSLDGGLTWQDPVLVAKKEGRLFTEPALLPTGGGTLLCMMRDDTTRIMHATISRDDGRTWSEPAPTGIDGYPAHLTTLADGRLLCTYGMRNPEFSIRAVLSADAGGTWTTEDPIMIRRHLPNRDLGYPSTVILPDGSLMTVYYCQDEHGVTGVECTRWRLPDTS